MTARSDSVASAHQGQAPTVKVGPGVIGQGARVVCKYGALPRTYANMTPAVVVSVGPKHTGVRVHGDRRVRRVPNDMVILDYHGARLDEMWPPDPRDVPLPYRGRRTDPRTHQWLPHYSWFGWTVAEHLAYTRGERTLKRPATPPPQRLVIVGCGGAKVDHPLDACNMYIGSYFKATRRAADALMGARRLDAYQVILSAKYGLLDLHDVIDPYDLRMGKPGSISAEKVAYQAQQLGLADAEEVIVLAGRAYADVVSYVWPHARNPLDGSAGIGEQLQRLALIAATGEIPDGHKEATVVTATLPNSDAAAGSRRPATDPAPVPAGATIRCPSCEAQAKVKRNGRVGSHYRGGSRQRCGLVDQVVPAGVTVIRLPDQDDLTLIDEMAEFFGGLMADALPSVLLCRAGDGAYGTVIGVGVDGHPRTVTGTLKKVLRIPGGPGMGRDLPRQELKVWMSDTVCGQRSVAVWVLGDAVLTAAPPPVKSPEDRLLEKVAARHIGPGMPVEFQILAARDVLGLSVELYDGPANELWRVEGCPEILSGEVAWWLFGGRYGSWQGREWAKFRVSRIAEAIAAGRYRPAVPAGEASALVQPVQPSTGTQLEGEQEYDRLLLAGELIDGAGRTLTAVDCFVCQLRRPHVITSGITCPYAIACPTCQAKVNEPCTRPSGHVVSEKFGGLHEARRNLARQVDDARAMAGDLTVPAPWPGSDAAARQADAPTASGPVLEMGLAGTDNPLIGRVGRESAYADAKRYAAGLPLVRKHRKLDRQWTFVCPVPTCLLMFDGHDTIRQARDHWFAHAGEHEGFTATWPDDVLPVESETDQKPARRPRRAGRKRTGAPSAVIEIVEPAGNQWWDDSALAWEKCGLLRRYPLRRTAGGPQQTVAVLLLPQGLAQAVGFAELLSTVGGIARDDMVVRVFTPEQGGVDERRGDGAQVEHRGAADPATHNRYDRDSLWQQQSLDADDILSTCTADTATDFLAWAVGVKHVAHAVDVTRYLSAGKASALRGSLCGATLSGGRQYSSNSKGCTVTWSDDYSAGHEVIASMSWMRVAKLVDRALAADKALAERIRTADAARCNAMRDRDGRGREAAENACADAVARMWQSARPVAAPAESDLAALMLFDLDAVATAVDEAYATLS